MLKKIILFVMLVCTFFAAGVNEVAAAEVTALHWGVNKDKVLRVVFDCDMPSKARVAIENDELLVTVNGKLQQNIAKIYTVKSDVVKQLRLEAKGEQTLLHMPLTKNIAAKDYKMFILKKDLTTNRPDRIVIDILGAGAGQMPAKVEKPVEKPKPTKPKKETSKPAQYKTNGGLKGKIIALDAGHGGTDPGAIGKQGTYEKTITLAIAKKVEDLLEQRGAKVYMTRTTDVDVYGPAATDAQELQARVDVAQDNKADAFVSLHCNASANRSVGGFSTYYYPKTIYDSMLAESIQNQITSNFGLDDLGTRQANFYVVKRSSMPSSLIEMAFISNPKEEKLLRSNWFQGKLAKVIVDGIEAYFDTAGGRN